MRGLEHEKAVEEAICCGWIDILVKHLDRSLCAWKFTPREKGSRWSTAGRHETRERRLREASGLLAAGRKLGLK